MSWDDYYDPGYLTPADVGESWTATIASIEHGEFTNDEGEIRHNAVLTFRGTNLRFRVNVTNKQLLKAIWGSNQQEKLFAFAPTRWLFEHSQAWNLIRHRLSSLVQRSLLRKQGMQSSAARTTPAAVELTRALLRLFVAEVRAAGAKPVLVVIPDRLGMATNFPLSAEELQALGVPWLDGRHFLTRDDYYRKDSHWRPVGHRLTAERLAALIELLPP